MNTSKAIYSSLMLILISCSCNRQSVQATDQYRFLNWYVKHEKIDTLEIQPVQFINPNSHDGSETGLRAVYKIAIDSTLIDEADVEFMNKQIQHNASALLFDTKHLKNTYLTHKKAGVKYYLSLPVFSADKNLVVFIRNCYCGSECDNGGIEVYKFTKGSWRKVELPISKWAS